MISIVPISFISQISKSDNLVEKLLPNLESHFPLVDNDVLVIPVNVVSLALGNTINFSNPVDRKKIIEKESKRILRSHKDLIISETSHGFICENGGVKDLDSTALLLYPHDIDKAAHSIRLSIKNKVDVDLPVIISDTFFKPFRLGTSSVALGISGINDGADELACAAGLAITDPYMDCALLRGVPSSYKGNAKGKDLVKANDQKLFV